MHCLTSSRIISYLILELLRSSRGHTRCLLLFTTNSWSLVSRFRVKVGIIGTSSSGNLCSSSCSEKASSKMNFSVIFNIGSSWRTSSSWSNARMCQASKEQRNATPSSMKSCSSTSRSFFRFRSGCSFRNSLNNPWVLWRRFYDIFVMNSRSPWLRSGNASSFKNLIRFCMSKEPGRFTSLLMKLTKKNLRRRLVNSSLLSNVERTILSLLSIGAQQPRLGLLVGLLKAKGCGFRPRKAKNASLQSLKDSISANHMKKTKLMTILVANRAGPKLSPRSNPPKTNPFNPSLPSSTKRAKKWPQRQIFTESLPTAWSSNKCRLCTEKAWRASKGSTRTRESEAQ